MKPINSETTNMKVITNKYLLVSLLVLSAIFNSHLTFAAANLEDTMAWVSKKVSNNFCDKTNMVKKGGQLIFSTQLVSADFSKVKSRYQVSKKYEDEDGEIDTQTRIFSLEDVIEIMPPSVSKDYRGTEYNECWYVLIGANAVKQRGIATPQYSVSLNFNDEIMAKRVKKALEHAVKLAKSEELF
jgi:hypothetical protein